MNPVAPPVAPAASAAPAARTIRRLAAAAALLMAATLLLSAFMRLSQAGLGCSDWPACYGQAARQMLGGALAPQGDGATALARLAHRVTAFAVLLIALWLVMLTWARRNSPEFRSAAWLLGCTLGLSLLGIFTPGALRPAVAMGNLLGGFVLLALCVRLAAPAPMDAPIRSAARLAAALLLLQAAAGVGVSASSSALACQDWAGCLQGSATGGWDWRALDPFQRPALLDDPPFNPGGALVQLVHRGLALPAGLAVLWLAFRCWRGGRAGEALCLALLLGAQVALALSLHPAGLTMGLVLAHNAIAAALVALALRSA